LCFAASTTFASANNASVEKPTDPIKKAVVTTVNTPNTDPKKDECGNEIKPEYRITCSATVGGVIYTAEAETFFRGEEGALSTCLRRLNNLLP